MFADIEGFNGPLAIVLVLVNIPVYWFFYRMLFTDVDELADAVKFWIKPEIFSAFRGEYFDDLWAEFKLLLLIVGCVGVVFLEYEGLAHLFAGGGAG